MNSIKGMREMSGRRSEPVYKQNKNQYRLGMSMAVMAVVMLIVVVGSNSISLKAKQMELQKQEQEYEQLIVQEHARAEELKELATYTKTKKYAEEVAKDKLGLVYENEIIFKESN